MIDVKFNYKNALGFVSEDEIHAYQPLLDAHYLSLAEKSGAGNDFLGWLDLPDAAEEYIREIELTAGRLIDQSEICVVIGIGGSYLGARSVIEALSNHFPHLDEHASYPLVLYAGQNISEDYMMDLIKVLDKKDYSLIVISKSGTTTEPAIAFRILKNHLESKYGKEASVKRIVAITDSEKGALKELSVNEGYETFAVPDDVGGRYSVLTAVGLLPIALAGFNIRQLLEGAKAMKNHLSLSSSINSNPASAYAAVRNALYQKGKTIEIMVNYEPRLFYITEWWKQLYGESEGKDNKGIFPAGVGFTTDLHSMGQYIQEGLRNIFETVLSVEKPKSLLKVPYEKGNLDHLNYISGKPIHYVNHQAETATTLAHMDGGVPNLKLSIPELNEKTLGELIYFYEMACALSGYILGINPFDQPGVEAYKKNMFALLGKPGFEKETLSMEARLKRMK